MNRYLVVYGIGGVFDDYTEIKGNSGVEALSSEFSDKVGIFKLCSLDDCQYMLKRIITVNGKDYTINRRVGYRYAAPSIERVL